MIPLWSIPGAARPPALAGERRTMNRLVHLRYEARSTTTPRPRPLRCGVWPLAALLAVLGLACRPPLEFRDLEGDGIFTAPPSRVLTARHALIEADRWHEARDLWATRSLLQLPPPDADDLESSWWKRLTAAAERAERGRHDAKEHYRQARLLQDVRWHREALTVVRRALDLDPELTSAVQLEDMLANLDTFTAEADSVARTIFARAQAGEAVGREVPRSVASLAASYGYVGDVLKRRGLYLGRRAPARGSEVWEAILAVIVEHRGATRIRRPTGEVNVRRVIVDDDRLPTYPGAVRSVWEAEPGIEATPAEIAVYHERDPHRRAGYLLWEALEDRAGAAPTTLAAMPERIAVAGDVAPPPPRPSRTDGDAEPDPATGDEDCDGRLADALRLRAAVPMYDQVRARSGASDEARRRFIVQLMNGRLVHTEQRIALAFIAAQRPGSLGDQRREERIYLDLLQNGPLPHWELAELIESACDAESTDPRTLAARAVRRFLVRTLDIDDDDGWLTLDKQEIRAAAARISLDRHRSP
jgi:hypothetical protein